MLGAFPRKDGMERKDLLAKNCGIFKEQVHSLYATSEGSHSQKSTSLRVTVNLWDFLTKNCGIFKEQVLNHFLQVDGYPQGS